VRGGFTIGVRLSVSAKARSKVGTNSVKAFCCLEAPRLEIPGTEIVVLKVDALGVP
jgi:hypothetical protein